MIIIVAGFPGSGKSYFAANLAARFGAIYMNSDRTRMALHASKKYSLEDKLRVYKEMLCEAVKNIEKNRDVVIDATFYHHTMREMFLEIAERYNIPLYVIEVIAEETLIRERLQKPRKYSEADFSVYEKVRNDFEEIAMPHLTLESTNENLEEMIERTRTYVKGEGK